MTKRLTIEIALQKLDDELVSIIRKYAEKTGNCELSIQVVDLTIQEQIKMYTPYKKIELNDAFLEELTKMNGLVYKVVTN